MRPVLPRGRECRLKPRNPGKASARNVVSRRISSKARPLDTPREQSARKRKAPNPPVPMGTARDLPGGRRARLVRMHEASPTAELPAAICSPYFFFSKGTGPLRLIPSKESGCPRNGSGNATNFQFSSTRPRAATSSTSLPPILSAIRIPISGIPSSNKSLGPPNVNTQHVPLCLYKTSPPSRVRTGSL